MTVSFVLLSSLFNSMAGAAGPSPIATVWVRQFGTESHDIGAGISADPFGNVYVSGYVGGTLSSPYAGGLTDVYVRKYNAAGGVVWTRQMGTGTDEQAASASTDALGNVFVSGWTFGDLAGTNSGSEDAFLAKYDASGNPLWSRQLGTNSNDYCYGVSTDGLGNAFITGYTNGSMAIPNSDGRDMFVAKYDAAGTLAWTRQYSPNVEQAGFGVSGDSLGNVYVTGYTGNSNVAGGIFDPFLNKYDAAGNLLWTRQLGTTHQAVSNGVSVDSLGNVYIGGWTSSNLGGGPIAGEHDAFVAKYNDLGTLQWVKQLGTSTIDTTNGVSTDGLGNVFVAGYTNGSLFDPSNVGQDAFLAKFDSAGNLLSIAQIGTTAQEQAYSVSADHFGNAFISGYSTSAGSVDVLVAKLTVIPEPATWLNMAYAVICLLAVGRSRRRDQADSPKFNNRRTPTLRHRT